VIPWAAILKHAPVMLAAADALLLRARGSEERKSHGVGERLTSLEQRDRESAQLLQDIARQMQALVVAQETTARRARVALGVAVAAGVLAACACGLAFLL
jgi:hypothetical protein